MLELGDVVVGEVLVGEVVLVGLVVLLLLPVHGFATVAVVPAGCDGLDEATVELELPAVVLGDVEAVVLPMLLSLEGVHGATVAVVPVVPVVPPVTLPALPAVLGVPEDEPIELEEGCDVGNVPALPVEVVPEGVDVVPDGVDVVPCGVEVVPGEVEVVPGEVEVVPGEVEVVPDGVDVVVPVCDPMPGLGVTVPVLCAEAIPRDNANAEEANRILRIETSLLSDLCD